MDTLCHAALVCCILSALAGLVRTFWPQNGFKPVINAVLTLYIVQPQAGGVHVRLVYPADREQAETLLQNFAGDLPYTLENTQ